MRIITTFIALLLAVANINAQEKMKDNVNFNVWPKGELNTAYILPLASQQTTSMETRREAGTQAQVGCFGDGMRDFWKSGPEDSRHINKWLADNCFGDYYTRTGLDLKMRELITFCFLAAQGGCEPQLKGHIAGNYHVGNDKDMLIAVISSNLPFIGYPRTLNALNCIRSVESDK